MRNTALTKSIYARSGSYKTLGFNLILTVFSLFFQEEEEGFLEVARIRSMMNRRRKSLRRSLVAASEGLGVGAEEAQGKYSIFFRVLDFRM